MVRPAPNFLALTRRKLASGLDVTRAIPDSASTFLNLVSISLFLGRLSNWILTIFLTSRLSETPFSIGSVKNFGDQVQGPDASVAQDNVSRGQGQPQRVIDLFSSSFDFSLSRTSILTRIFTASILLLSEFSFPFQTWIHPPPDRYLTFAKGKGFYTPHRVCLFLLRLRLSSDTRREFQFSKKKSPNFQSTFYRFDSAFLHRLTSLLAHSHFCMRCKGWVPIRNGGGNKATNQNPRIHVFYPPENNECI